jgi:hypothetical protein
MKAAQMILNTFIKNCDSIDDAFKRVEKTVKGELKEFTAKNLDGYMAYGNGEVLIFLDNEEEPYTVYVDTYGDKKTFTWG